MSSNVGIYLKEPKNLNTLLCHFYTADNNIICIKKIILEGRNVDENISLLKVSSYFGTMIINSYIITCFIRNSKVIMGQLNFLEIILLIFSILSFTGKPNNNFTLNPLNRDAKLFNLHYYIQIIGIFIFKIISIYFASYFYMTNFDINIEIVDKIFCTYYFILCIELILSIAFSFNFISLSRKHSLSKFMFITFTLLLILYFINLISLNSSNFKTDFFKITFFEYQENLIDSFDDRNRMHLILVCILDFFVSFFYSRIFYYIFYKVSEHNSMKKIEIIN
jgi:magnesium-transporting ATPase (P-type)